MTRGLQPSGRRDPAPAPAAVLGHKAVTAGAPHREHPNPRGGAARVGPVRRPGDPCFQAPPPVSGVCIQEKAKISSVLRALAMVRSPWGDGRVCPSRPVKRREKSLWCREAQRSQILRLSPRPLPPSPASEPQATEKLKNNIRISLWLQRYKSIKVLPSAPRPAHLSAPRMRTLRRSRQLSGQPGSGGRLGSARLRGSLPSVSPKSSAARGSSAAGGPSGVALTSGDLRVRRQL